MARKRLKKPRLKQTQNRNMVLYVENNSLKGKVFKDVESLNVWVDKFNKNNPELNDNWIDLIVTGIKGNITPVDPSMKIR